MVEETQTSLPMTPATNNNGSADGGGSLTQNIMIANAFESDSSEENDKISEMRNTLNKQQKQITTLINDTLFWKTKVILHLSKILNRLMKLKTQLVTLNKQKKSRREVRASKQSKIK